tara:strand:+ start:477 stop:1595 length:1119 start_codon:yes stop_codon:yes gene_type:complete
MKRSHARAFQKDDLFLRLPKDCEEKILDYFTLQELCRGLAPCSSRTRDLVYAPKHWRRISIRGMRNDHAVSLLRLHGRAIERIRADSMRASRAFCDRLMGCKGLQELDLRGIWKSPAVNNRFVSAISSLPLRVLLFGKNELGATGFQRLCHSLAGSLEELDFNSTTLPLRAYYQLVKLRRLRSLTLRCCSQVDQSLLPFLGILERLSSLQLSFLPRLSGAAVASIADSGLCKQLQTLVLNGMYLSEHHCFELNKLRSLRTLSVCHPNIDSRALQRLSLPNLGLLTIFCSKYLDSFEFLRRLPCLKMLCLYRCAVSVRSMQETARACPRVDFKVFMPRKIRAFGVEVSDEELDLAAHPNISHLNLMSRPYPFV